MASPVQPMVLEAFGVLIAVQPPDAAARDRWQGQWSRAITAAPADQAAVTIDATQEDGDEDPDTVDYRLTSLVTRTALEHVGASRLSLHAAGLADSEGRGLALVAASGTGKTTAARTLGATMGYLSDETVSVGPDLDVRPYPKPLSVLVDAAGAGHKAQHSPDELGLLPAPERITLHRLVILDRTGGHERHGLEPLSIADAIPFVLPQTSYFTSFPDPLLALTRLLRVGGGPWVLRYADIAEHAAELHALMSEADEEPEAFTHHPGCKSVPPGLSGSLVREPWDDAVEFENTVVTLSGGTAYTLDHLGATIWLALDQPADLEWLVAAAEHRHGEHPDSHQLIQDAVDVLIEASIVRRL